MVNELKVKDCILKSPTLGLPFGLRIDSVFSPNHWLYAQNIPRLHSLELFS